MWDLSMYMFWFFILQFIPLDFVLIIFSGGKSIVIFFIQSPSQVQSFSSDTPPNLLLQNDTKFQIHTEYMIKFY